MLNITEEALKKLESQTSRALVGEVCKLIEELSSQDLPKENCLNLLKQLLKNKVYESARNHTLLITKFSEGFATFQIELTKPKA